MRWSLDFIGAAELALDGAFIRRVAWTDRWLRFFEGGWYRVAASGTRLVEFEDYEQEDLMARDWTTAGFSADPCAATPAFNESAPVYHPWTDEPMHMPPPPPGFPDA